MGDALRWAIAVGAVLCVIGLASYARGTEHHRGDDIGSHGTKVVVVQVEER
jgi:hypothetical protein